MPLSSAICSAVAAQARGRPVRRACPRHLPSHPLQCSGPLREPSRGVTSRRASYVVSCTTGTSRSRARSADSSLSAIPSPCRRRSSAGVTSTIPTRDFATPFDFAQQWRAEDDVLLAEPDRNTEGREQIVKVLGGPSPVAPPMAEKDVPKVRQERSLFDALANRRECPHLGRCVRHGRTDSRPSWPSAAAGPADAAPDTTPAALQRGWDG